MYKIIIYSLVVGAVLGALVMSFTTSSTIEYKEPQTVEKEVVVPELETLIKEAQDGARAEVEAFAQEAYNDAYEQRMKEIATDIRTEYIEQLKKINEAEKREVEAY